MGGLSAFNVPKYGSGGGGIGGGIGLGGMGSYSGSQGGIGGSGIGGGIGLGSVTSGLGGNYNNNGIGSSQSKRANSRQGSGMGSHGF